MKRTLKTETLTTREVAELLGVSQRYVRRLCERGVLLGFQPTGPRGDWRVSRSFVSAIIDMARAFNGDLGTDAGRPTP